MSERRVWICQCLHNKTRAAVRAQSGVLAERRKRAAAAKLLEVA